MTSNEPMQLGPWRGGLVALPEPVTPGMSVDSPEAVCEDLPENP